MKVILKISAIILLPFIFATATSKISRGLKLGDYCFNETCPCESINGTIIEGWCLP